jgi:hypothetical protein
LILIHLISPRFIPLSLSLSLEKTNNSNNNNKSLQRQAGMSGHDSKYFSTTKKGEIPELKEELNSQYKVRPPSFSFPSFYISITLFKQMLFYDLDL